MDLNLDTDSWFVRLSLRTVRAMIGISWLLPSDPDLPQCIKGKPNITLMIRPSASAGTVYLNTEPVQLNILGNRGLSPTYQRHVLSVNTIFTYNKIIISEIFIKKSYNEIQREK